MAYNHNSISSTVPMLVNAGELLLILKAIDRFRHGSIGIDNTNQIMETPVNMQRLATTYNKLCHLSESIGNINTQSRLQIKLAKQLWRNIIEILYLNRYNEDMLNLAKRLDQLIKIKNQVF